MVLTNPHLRVPPTPRPLRDETTGDFLVKLKQNVRSKGFRGESTRGNELFYAKDLLRQQWSQLRIA